MKGFYIKIIVFLFAILPFTAVAVTYESYTLIKSADELVSGDTVVVASIGYGKVMGALRSVGTNRESLDITFLLDSSTIVLADTLGYTKLCIERRTTTSSNWSLCTSEGKYLYTGGGTTGNYLKETANKQEAFFTISFDEDGNATIEFDTTKDQNILGYYNGDVTSSAVKIFSCYRENSGDRRSVQLYSKGLPVYVLKGTEQDDDNSETIAALVEPTDTTDYYVVINREFEADGGWYTLCLPFGLTVDEVSEQCGGAKFEQFVSATTGGNDTLSLNFATVSETQAGVPYMVQPVSDIKYPLFMNKTAEVTSPVKSTYAIDGEGTDSVSFVGVFEPTALTTDKTQRFVSSDGVTLTYSNNEEDKLNALRAYVQFPESYAESDEAKIAFDVELTTEPETDPDTDVETDPDPDSELNGIAVVEPSHGTEGETIYTIGGTRVAADATSLPKGAYISGGKKFIVK